MTAAVSPFTVPRPMIYIEVKISHVPRIWVIEKEYLFLFFLIHSNLSRFTALRMGCCFCCLSEGEKVKRWVCISIYMYTISPISVSCTMISAYWIFEWFLVTSIDFSCVCVCRVLKKFPATKIGKLEPLNFPQMVVGRVMPYNGLMSSPVSGNEYYNSTHSNRSTQFSAAYSSRLSLITYNILNIP